MGVKQMNAVRKITPINSLFIHSLFINSLHYYLLIHYVFTMDDDYSIGASTQEAMANYMTQDSDTAEHEIDETTADNSYRQSSEHLNRFYSQNQNFLPPRRTSYIFNPSTMRYQTIHDLSHSHPTAHVLPTVQMSPAASRLVLLQ